MSRSLTEDNLDELKRSYEKLTEIADGIVEDASKVSVIQFANLNFELMRVTRVLINELGMKLDIDPWKE